MSRARVGCGVLGVSLLAGLSAAALAMRRRRARRSPLLQPGSSLPTVSTAEAPTGGELEAELATLLGETEVGAQPRVLSR